MKKYAVYQIVTYDMYQEVEAESEEKAIELAKEYGNWEDPQDRKDTYEAIKVKQ